MDVLFGRRRSRAIWLSVGWWLAGLLLADASVALSATPSAEPTSTTTLAAAVLPSSRSALVGNVATAFATIINTGAAAARGCSIAPPDGLSARFGYQTTDPSTNLLIGFANSPADIPVGGLQTFVIAIMPVSPFGPTDVPFTFACTNAPAAPVISGVNTLLLSATTSPRADVVALAGTLNNDGIVAVPSASAGVFAVATVNVGATDRIEVSTDTGRAGLQLMIQLCQTDPATGRCVTRLVSTLAGVMTAGSTFTF